jgi:hypothetical protein
MNGLHLIGDLGGCRCDPQRLLDGKRFESQCVEMVRAVGLTVMDSNFHQFEGSGYTGTVVRFDSDEGRDSVLEGFTITHGRDSVHAGGVHADGASPTLRNNRIVDNIGGSQGHGISLLHSAALIEGNWIAGNRSASAGHGAGGGGGIGIYGPGAVLGSPIASATTR